ncbi:hypothetical protein Tco_1128468, partial [Tanacetum coccineum]
MTTTVFAATNPKNTPFAYRASTSANPNPMICPERAKKADTEATPSLRPRSPEVRRQRKRVVGFEEAPNREGSRAGRNAEGSRPLEIEARENGNMGMNLPSLLAAHLGRKKSGQPLQSFLTSVYGGHQPSTNIRGISLLTIRFSYTMSNLSYLVVCIYPLDLCLLILTPTPNHMRASLMGNLRVSLSKLRM